MGSQVKMISFRLNRDKAGDRIIWDYLEQEGANRSQLIKELLIHSLEEREGKGSESKGEKHYKENQILLLKIRNDLQILKNLEEMRERLCSIDERLSFLQGEDNSSQGVDETEAAFLQTIFEKNPIEVT